MSNEKACLFTQDLVSACRWANTAPISEIKPDKLPADLEQGTTWRTKAFIDLKNKLGRVRGDFPVAAQNGVSFERAVYAEAKDPQGVGSDKFQKVVKLIKGGDFQHKLKMDYEYRGMHFFLYGKEDVHFPKQIIDIKTTEKFKLSKYKDSFQHQLYCFIDQIESFVYVIAEWDKENGGYPLIKQVYEVECMVDLEKAKQRIEQEMDFVVNFLKEYNLWELYRETYCLY